MGRLTTAPSSGRIEWIDVAKGLGALMVVYGHSHGPYNHFFYQFHMPLFFILSGYLYSRKDSFGRFFKKKFLSLYVPFVSWNLIVQGICFYYGYVNGMATEYFISSRTRIARLTLLTLGKDGNNLGATWFLGGLFMVSICYKLIDTLIPSKWKHREKALLLIAFAAMEFAFYNTLPLLQSRTVILGFFFAAGVFLKQYQEKLRRFSNMYLAFLVTVFFIIISVYTRSNMGKNVYTSRILFVLAAFSGSYVTACFADWLSRRKLFLFRWFKSLFAFIGQKSMDILIWQFIAFRFCSAYQLFLEGRPVLDALTEGARYNTSGNWWIFYFVVGTVLPILWGYVLRFGPWGWVFKKLHFV